MQPRNYALGLSANSTASSFTAPTCVSSTSNTDAPTTTAIKSTGNAMNVLPFGAGSDTQTFSMRVIGYSKHQTSASAKQWVPHIICQLACTLCPQTGATATTKPTSSELICDTITITNGTKSAVVDTQFADTAAIAVVDITGYEYIDFTFDMTGATSGNCLYQMLEDTE